ncbi:MAG: low specificity L-threonine aldolase [Candidatus Kapaibacterium sp.]|nr:MAG: low specificity L-threonine aldolase [Candidatus Kapabacteria bacterium]
MTPQQPFRSFASDNNAGIHPAILEALTRANTAHALAYGQDALTKSVQARLKEEFGNHAESYFAFNGTGANVLALQAMTRSFHAILCAETAHINVDECGAPEKFTGCKLIPIPTPDGKLTPELIQPHLHGFGVEHHSQVNVLALTQSSEYGTVYSLAELRAITELARQHGLYVFMDGARLANAAAHLGCSLRAMTTDVGIDAVSFGGTKNGTMLGEAVIFCNAETVRELSNHAAFIRKQSMQLASKMRYVAAQFDALLTNELWRNNALHANNMAQTLASALGEIPNVAITQDVQANAVFAILPNPVIKRLLEQFFFYVWKENVAPDASEVRLMASFDTTDEEIRDFAYHIHEAMHGGKNTARQALKVERI